MQNYKNKFPAAAILLAAVFLASPLKAQVTIGKQIAPQSFSALELISGKSGLRLPQLTTIQRNALEASPDFQNQKTGLAKGLAIFNKDTRCVNVWDGAAWIEWCEPLVASPATITEITDDVPSCTGPVADGGVTNDAAPTVKGVLSAALAAGETVVIYRTDNDGPAVKLPGAATVTGTNWIYEDSNLQNNHTYVYTAKVVSAANIESAPSSPWTIRIDTDRPTQIVKIVYYTDAKMNQTGDFDFTVPTNDVLPVINGTIDKLPGPGETLVLYRADGAAAPARIAAIPVGSDLKWSYKETTNLSEGAHTYSARVEDAACNASDMPVATLTVKTKTQSDPGINQIVGIVRGYRSLTGPIAYNGYSNDPLPLFKGTDADSYGRMTIYDNGNPIGASMADMIGIWNYRPPYPLADGPKVITVTSTDAAGNEGPPSNVWLYTQLVAPPTNKATIDSFSDGANDFPSGTTTTNPRPTLKGSIVDRNGQPTQLNPGELIRISYASGNSLVGFATPDAGGTTWTFQPTDPIKNNTTANYQVNIMDGAGNLGNTWGTFTITVSYDDTGVTNP